MPMKRKNYEPENPRSWRRVYERYDKEEREAEAHALAQLGATYAGLNKRKQENKTGIADPRLLPKIGRIGARRSRGGFGTGTTNLTFGGGARTQNVVLKAKKEAMEVAARKKLSTPVLKPRANLVKVQRAPESMRNEHRIKRQPAFLPQIPKPGTTRPRDRDDERAQREARLLAAKKPKVQPMVLRDDELEDSSATKFNAADARKPATAATTRLGASSNVKKSVGLFSRAHNPSRQQNKVIVKTSGQAVSRTSPEKATTVLKTRPSHPTEMPKKYPSSSKPRIASPSSQSSSRPSRITPRQPSRSPSAGSSLFGSPEPGSPASEGRRSSFHSSDGNGPAPSTKRTGTPEAANVQPGETKAGTSSKRRIEGPAIAGTSSAAAISEMDGEAGAQPLRKKQKKVDIFMRPKKAGR